MSLGSNSSLKMFFRVKNCQTDSHLKSAQRCLSNIKPLSLILVVLKHTLHMILPAMWNFEFCTVSQKPRKDGLKKKTNLQKPTNVQMRQNLQDNRNNKRTCSTCAIHPRDNTRDSPFFNSVQMLLYLFLLGLFQSKSCSVIQKSTKSAFIFFFCRSETIN